MTFYTSRREMASEAIAGLMLIWMFGFALAYMWATQKGLEAVANSERQTKEAVAFYAAAHDEQGWNKIFNQGGKK